MTNDKTPSRPVTTGADSAPEADIASLALSPNEQAAVGLLRTIFGNRAKATVENGTLVITLIPESQLENTHPNEKTRQLLSESVAQPGFNFNSCTPAQLRLFLHPVYSDILDDALLEKLWRHVSTEFSLNNLDILEMLLNHPHASPKIIDDITAFILNISPEILAQDEVAFYRIHNIFCVILSNSRSTPTAKKRILLIPHFIETLVANNNTREELIMIITAARECQLDEKDCEMMFENAAAFKTILLKLEYIINLSKSELPFITRWFQVKDQLST